MITQEEYSKTAIRMMDSLRKTKEHMGKLNCSGVDCSDCPLGDCCNYSRMEAAYSIVEIVEKWGKEHPIVTNADKYREVFGVSPINVDKTFVCPERVGFSCKCKETSDCGACKIDFWTAEYKTPKEEDK